MNTSGITTRLQLGVETTFGTAITPTLGLEYTSESLVTNKNYIESAALTGARGRHGMTPSNESVSGDFSFEMNPKNISLILYLAYGDYTAEGADLTYTGTYTHSFAPASGDSSLPSFTTIIDRKVDQFTYPGCKVNSLSVEASPDGYLMGTVSLTGLKEVLTGVAQELSYSDQDPFTWKDFTLKVGTEGSTPNTVLSDATSFSYTFDNGLEDPLYVADGTAFSKEYDYQQATSDMTVDVLYTDAINAYRESNFKTGVPVSISASWDSGVAVEDGGPNYTLSITMLHAIVSEATFNVSGPERIRGSLNIQGVEKSGDNLVDVVTVNNIDEIVSESTG